MDFVFILLLVMNVILNVLDGLTTWLIIKPDKFQREANPVARWLFIKMGIPNGIIIVEAVWISTVSLVVFWVAGRNMLLAKMLLGLGFVVFGWIVQGSFRIMKKLGQKNTAV